MYLGFYYNPQGIFVVGLFFLLVFWICFFFGGCGVWRFVWFFVFCYFVKEVNSIPTFI